MEQKESSNQITVPTIEELKNSCGPNSKKKNWPDEAWAQYRLALAASLEEAMDYMEEHKEEF